MNNKTGEIIEKYRKENKLTQAELANKLGVSKSAISKWENGNNLPDITLLEPLSEILGIDKLQLFTSENISKEENNERIKSIKRKNSIKTTIITLLFIFSILFTNYISYKIYKHKLSMLQTPETEVYRFYSTDEEYYVNGYIIFQDGKSTILFDQLKYQDIHQTRTKAKDKIKSAELHLYVNNELTITNIREVAEKDENDINKALYDLITSATKKTDHPINQNNLQNSYVKLVITKETKTVKKEIKLELSHKI